MIKSNGIFRVALTGMAALILSSISANISAQETVIDSTLKVETGSIDDLPAKPFRMPSLQDVGGSPFLTTDFRQGTVELGQGRVVNNVPIKFNTFNNVMLVIKNGEELKLEFFESVQYDENDGTGAKKHYTFRAGYPAIDNLSENTIYQVLSSGPKLHLLKFIAQKVEDVPTLGDYSRREIVTTEQYFVYVPGGEMKRIKSLKAAKQSIQEAVPSLSARIDEISTARKLKLKSESDFSILVEELNKP